MDIKKKNWFARHKIWTGVLGIIVLFIVIGAASGGKSSNSSNSSSSSQTSQSSNTGQPAQWSVQAAYDKVQNGMTKAQVEQATGKPSTDCTESQDNVLGKTELCTYGNAFTDKGTITVTYSNDVVSSKTKSTY